MGKAINWVPINVAKPAQIKRTAPLLAYLFRQIDNVARATRINTISRVTPNHVANAFTASKLTETYSSETPSCRIGKTVVA
ncbi:MAG: hypothetical protein K0S80_3216 [Neobacillus sp.]|nr:hypothetical protein [Neobacillus sp.]